jgi:hypothetical protein
MPDCDDVLTSDHVQQRVQCCGVAWPPFDGDPEPFLLDTLPTMHIEGHIFTRQKVMYFVI